MELDPRIIEGKKPLTCFDLEQAKDYVGKKGYFSDYLNVYTNIRNMEESVLQSLDEHHDEAFLATRNKWEFFLPAEWVKPEKKCRPFTGVEFAEKFDIWVGYIIRIRDRPENAGQSYEYKIMFAGYRWYKNMFEVFINGCWIDLLTLFELYEYMKDGEWHKFGVEE